MKVMIIEPLGEGHHMHFVRLAVRKFLRAKFKLSLVTRRSAIMNPSYQLVKAETNGCIKTYFLPELKKNSNSSSLSILLKQFKEWFVLKYKFSKIIKINKPDIIYIPDLDWVAKAIEILGSPFQKIPFVALYMSPKFHRKLMGLGAPSRYDWLFDKLFKRLLKIPTLQKLIVMDEFFYKFVKKNYKSLAAKIVLAPDFAHFKMLPSKKISRISLGISKNSKVILVYGYLDLKKGIPELLLSLFNTNVPNDLVILLAGQPSTEIIQFMKSNAIKKLLLSRKIITCFKFHDLSDERRVFAAADAVWLGYTQGFLGSSGVMYQAIHSNLSIIGQNKGIIGSYIKKYKLGIAVSPSNPKKVIKGIRDLFDNLDVYSKNNKFRKILKKYHCPDMHYKVILSSLNKYV